MSTPTTDDVRHEYAVSFRAEYQQEARQEFDAWLAEHDAKVRAETFRGAAQSVRAEARWQAEQKVRGAVQRSGAETAVDRLLVIEKLFHEQADQIEREAGLK